MRMALRFLAFGACLSFILPCLGQEGVDLTPMVQDTSAEKGTIPTEDRDADIASKLERIFASIPALSGVTTEVNGGVVTLRGNTASAGDAKDAAGLAERIEHVIYVLNRIETPQDLGSQLSPAWQRLQDRLAGFITYLPLLVVAIIVVGLFWLLARVLSGWEGLYAWLFRSAILRGVASRVITSIIILTGILVALEMLDATALVGAVFGAAGLIGLALGFAFRDIAENYLASVILGVRRPFATGDLVRIEGHEGRVIRLTTRETILMTLDGNHVRLPNSLVFKSVISNYTRNPLRRFDFSVGMGLEEDLVRAQQLGLATLAECAGVLKDPPPFAIIEELGDSAVAMRFLAWMDQDGTDFHRTRSEAMRRVKVRMDDEGVDMPIPGYQVHLTGDGFPQAGPATRKPLPESPGQPAPAEPAATEESLRPRDELGPQIAQSEEDSTEQNLLADP